MDLHNLLQHFSADSEAEHIITRWAVSYFYLKKKERKRKEALNTSATIIQNYAKYYLYKLKKIVADPVVVVATNVPAHSSLTGSGSTMLSHNAQADAVTVEVIDFVLCSQFPSAVRTPACSSVVANCALC